MAGPRLHRHSHGHSRFADPYGLVVDAAGTLIVADAGDNNRIRRIAPDGQVSSLAGGVEGLRDGRGADASFHTLRIWRSTLRATCMSPTPATMRSASLIPQAG